MQKTGLFIYTLQLGDNALIIGQRNAEWCGHGPVLEQDIAITNISLDFLGQARNFYQYAAALYNEMDQEEKKVADRYIPRLWKTYGRELEEDDLAFLRDEHQYLNLLITELPKGDWAQTILRQFFFSAFQMLHYSKLKNSSIEQLSAIAEKSIKEVAYHLRWSSEWVIRLGDGTEESNERIRKALSNLWAFTGESFLPSKTEEELASMDLVPKPEDLKEEWLNKVRNIFDEAGLQIPVQTWNQKGGKEGKHTEHLGFLLAEMQYLQRTFPDAKW
jgi:ring-1,2-phenylacetyl-CoA epoxidase subunit PaaC